MGVEIIESFNEKDTALVGERLAKECIPGLIITLNGDLGTGKTVFTKGFGKGLGILEPVCSPTFTIMQIYEGGRLPLYHFDVYRIADIEEMDEIGYEDFFFGNGVCLVEWAELIRELLPERRVDVTLSKDLDKGFDYRRIEILYPE